MSSTVVNATNGKLEITFTFKKIIALIVDLTFYVTY